MASAQSGPVVVISLNKTSCDALIIQPGLAQVVHVPLSFTYEQVEHTRTQLDHLVHRGDPTGRYPVFSVDDAIDNCENMLAVLWLGVVKPVLGVLGYLVSEMATVCLDCSLIGDL